MEAASWTQAEDDRLREKEYRRSIDELAPEIRSPTAPDELTLRGEEVGTSKALVNVDSIEKEGWGPPQVDADWYAFCKALYKGIEGEDREEVYFFVQRNEKGCGPTSEDIWPFTSATLVVNVPSHSAAERRVAQLRGIAEKVKWRGLVRG